MQVTFLGTGTSQGIPVIACRCEVCQSTDSRDNRLRSSVMIEVSGKTFVIDTGPDFRQQMLREKVLDLTAAVYTHEHKDHVAGMDDVRAFNFILRKHIDLYVSDNVEIALKREFPYVFADEKYPGVPMVNLHKYQNSPFEIEGVEFIPIRVFHHKLPVFGFRVGDFTYITDANTIPEEEKDKIKGSKILVLNALRKKSHISHFTLNEAVEVVKEFQPQKAYFTHASHQLGLHEEVERELPDNVHLAYDGLKITL